MPVALETKPVAAPVQQQAPSTDVGVGIARAKDATSGLPAPINALPGYALGLLIGALGVVGLLAIL